jgi:hypothetical protein
MSAASPHLARAAFACSASGVEHGVRHRVWDLQHSQSIRIGKDRVQKRPHVPDCLRRERPSLGFGFRAPTTVILEVMNSRLDLSGCEIVQTGDLPSAHWLAPSCW